MDHRRRRVGFGWLAAVGAVGTAAAVGALAGGCAATEEAPLPDDSILEATAPPPPISGGTLLVTNEGKTAVIADSDRDRVWIVDLAARKLLHEVALSNRDEPGRVVEGQDGRVFVALRQSGAVVTIDLESGKVEARRAACAAPRGMAYDAAKSLLHVACAGGELVSLSGLSGGPARELKLESDLRDIVVDGDRLFVSRFRSAEVLVVDSAGSVASRVSMPGATAFDLSGKVDTFEPFVAWRMVAAPGGGVVLVHQQGTTKNIDIEDPTTPYGGGDPGGGCDPEIHPILHGAITSLVQDADGNLVADADRSGSLIKAALPVDVALAKDSDMVAAVSAGTKLVYQTKREQMFHSPHSDCGPPDITATVVPGQPVSVGFGQQNEIVVFMREPAGLFFPTTGETMLFSAPTARSVGHNIFHLSPTLSSSLACASCHPEGQHDGRTWNFSPIGARRTQSLGGGVLATMPFHWDGDLFSTSNLMAEVFSRRMGGETLGPIPQAKFDRWLDTIPTVPHAAPNDPAAVERGQALFFDAKVACASCHAGPQSTNNTSADVGTGRAFQVPQLMGLADRAPYMHDGCAKTLRDRFDPSCGGGDKHGVTSHLSETQISDLVAYLETL